MKKGVVIIGMPGCGKTTLGRELAQKLGYKFVDMDNFIENSTKQTVSEIFEKRGEHIFREFETKSCEVLSRLDECVISTGGGVVKKDINMKYFNDFIVMFVNRPLELILEDVDIKARPLLKDNKANIINIYRERIDLYNQYADVIVINDYDIETVVSEMVVKIKEFNEGDKFED